MDFEQVKKAVKSLSQFCVRGDECGVVGLENYLAYIEQSRPDNIERLCYDFGESVGTFPDLLDTDIEKTIETAMHLLQDAVLRQDVCAEFERIDFGIYGEY